MNQTDRLLAIVLELQTHQWQRAADLAETLDVSTRTIYRDMQALDEAGVPVVAVPGKGYRLSEGYFLPPLTLTTDEAILLLLGSDQIGTRLDVNYQAAANAVKEKLEAILPEHLRGEVATLRNRLRLVPVNAFDHPEEQAILPPLRRALMEQHVIRFCYPDDGDASPVERMVHPYGLVQLAGAWHLVGQDHVRQRVQHFRLSRITELDVLDQTFERPSGYRPEQGSVASAHDLVVRVLFAPEVAPWVKEAPSFYTVDTEEHPDGLLVTLKVQRETEVLPWLLSWGSQARVLEPASLRRRLGREARKLADRYREEPTLLSYDD